MVRWRIFMLFRSKETC